MLIAPCGMNCRLCRAYQRARNPCLGCRGDDSRKPRTRTCCSIKTCSTIEKVSYCFSCRSFPCFDLSKLDKRYSTKYGMSMIENLESVKRSGVRLFIGNEKKKWTCPGCGELLCVHEPKCAKCGYLWR